MSLLKYRRLLHPVATGCRVPSAPPAPPAPVAAVAPANLAPSFQLRLCIDGQVRAINAADSQLLSPQLIAVQLPDSDPILVADAGEVLSALAKAMQTKPSRCGSYKGVRPLRKGAAGKRIVYFPSLKNKGQIQCESRLEAVHAMSLEREPSVVAYRFQPIRLIFDGWSYTPDVLIQDHEGSLRLCEVKPNGKLENFELFARLAVVRVALARCAVPFEVSTELCPQHPSEEEADNYLRMDKSRKHPDLTEHCEAAFQQKSVWRRSELNEYFLSRGLAGGLAERLIWDGELSSSAIRARTKDRFLTRTLR